MNNKYKKNIDSILKQIPFVACRLDTDFQLRYCNQHFLALMEKSLPVDIILDLPFEALIAFENYKCIEPYLYNALNEQLPDVKGKSLTSVFGNRTYEITIVPHHTSWGFVDDILLFAHDITSKEKLSNTEKELNDYISALNAHAIVAVTDIQGCITFVNDKFCEISQYSREELYGHTHRLVKSGYHSDDFYIELWNTISNGRVWQGEICNRAKDGSHYWVHSTIVPFVDSAGLPIKYISIRADITKLKLVEQQAKQLALYDPLTNLPNRRLFQDRLAQVISASSRREQYCALISVDLDDFKRVNDLNGHAQGDLLLRKVAMRLSQAVRESDTVARMGGDEFLLILSDLGTRQADAIHIANKISIKLRTALNKPYRLDIIEDVTDSGVSSTASMGVVIFQGHDTSSDDLLQQVDIALYCAKENGRNQIVFFDLSQKESANTRFAIELALRDAISNREFHIHYQPIVDSSKKVIGLEALLRWSHPIRGMVPPDVFIPVAEQIGLITPIGYWVFEKVCLQLAELQKNPHCAHWTIGVNVSARQFNDSKFVEQIELLLRRYNFHPNRLLIELTESVFLNSHDCELLEKINALKKIGIRFALDDFGTGFSSLTYLKNLPLDILKIDRTFVQTLLKDPKNQIITGAIISLANSLELRVIAEGVETNEQFEYLLSLGCSNFQGYLFGRPEPLSG